MGEQEFIAMVNKNQGIIHKICRLYTFNNEDYNDMSQEILLQLWRSFDTYKGDAKFSTWMYQVAINTAVTFIRKSKRNIPLTPLNDIAFQIPDTSSVEEENKLKLLQNLLNMLSKVDKAIVLLYLEGLKYEEIAESIGITKTNVSVRLVRIKRSLKKIAKNHLNFKKWN